MNQLKIGNRSIKRNIFLVLAMIIMTIIVGCTNTNQSNTSLADDNNNQENETSQTMTPASINPTVTSKEPEVSTDTENEDDADDIYVETDSNNLGALAFLGGGLKEKELEQKKQQVIDAYLIGVKELPFYNYGGPEFFCIIPHYVGSEITVKRSELSEQGELVAKETLVTTDQPIIIQCNESDLYSNVMITIEYNDESTTFTPFISLKDGSVMPADKMEVLDLRTK